MQLMSWQVARLGSRFSLFFEPYRRRVMHSALGRSLDAPLDLMVGLVEPDGRQRVLPFSQQGELLLNCEQFPRINSITFRGFAERYQLRYEFNVHAVYYPQNEELCLLPAFYLEMRVNPTGMIRWIQAVGPTPEKVRLFIRLNRPDTEIRAAGGNGEPAFLDLRYRNRLEPVHDAITWHEHYEPPPGPTVQVHERIVSLNPEAVPEPDGHGLTLELPVTEEGSGIKWRLVWAAYVGDPVLQVSMNSSRPVPARFRYTRYWKNIDQVVEAAITRRDDHLNHSRRFEKIIDQSPLQAHEHHLLCQGFQTYLANTFWCQLEDGREWFSVWEGGVYQHSTVDVEYNAALVHLCLWPRLLKLELDEWPAFTKSHEASGGLILNHDMGYGPRVGRQSFTYDMPVEENADYLLMLQAYCHLTGDLELVHKHAVFLERLARYLMWVDRDGSGFACEGTRSTFDAVAPAAMVSRKHTYLAVKRVAALAAAADLLERAGRQDVAAACRALVEKAPEQIEQATWLGDHFAVCTDPAADGVVDVWTGKPLTSEQTAGWGWDAYSIHTANGLLYPLLFGGPVFFSRQRLINDLISATRETQGRYACGHTSVDKDNVWISQNLWRDFLARYLGARIPNLSGYYWDMQVSNNTHDQSYAFIDTYVQNRLAYYPRGATTFGWFFAGPRLVIDRLAPEGAQLRVQPDTHSPQRWPLLALADWKAGKIPICVVDPQGRISIEGEIDPITVLPFGSPGTTSSVATSPGPTSAVPRP